MNPATDEKKALVEVSTTTSGEFSFRSRVHALRRFRHEEFDLLVVGGGITGAGVARDAVSRGLKVALVEREDFAFGTSSRSSKLIHGGLRYLENFEFGLVFESLAERAHLLRTVPHMVRPLPFYLPTFHGDRHGRNLLDIGLWLYDFLALFRTPGFHRRLSRKKLQEAIPFLREDGLTGGFRYFDASMWDDVLAVETLRSAHESGAAIANYVEAIGPLWKGDRICGYRVRDREVALGQGEIDLRAKQVVICGGPYTDLLGGKLSDHWPGWLNPSKGVHLIFDLKRIPLPGAVTMTHPEDGRVAFVIPRPDFGAGVVIVGTTDGPTPAHPDQATIEPEDVRYLLSLLNRYFPSLELTEADILSGYVGVRPLVGSGVMRPALPPASAGADSSSGVAPANGGTASELRKVSREHHIGRGPGGTVVVAGGKYTTYRRMAQEIVDVALEVWRTDARASKVVAIPSGIRKSATLAPVNPRATTWAVEQARRQPLAQGGAISESLFARYGAEALEVYSIHEAERGALAKGANDPAEDPEGFPLIEAQLRHLIRTSMVLHLTDFYFRRVPLYLSRADHGRPWIDLLSRVWAQERGLGPKEAEAERERLVREMEARSWKSSRPS